MKITSCWLFTASKFGEHLRHWKHISKHAGWYLEGDSGKFLPRRRTSFPTRNKWLVWWKFHWCWNPSLSVYSARNVTIMIRFCDSRNMVWISSCVTSMQPIRQTRVANRTERQDCGQWTTKTVLAQSDHFQNSPVLPVATNKHTHTRTQTHTHTHKGSTTTTAESHHFTIGTQPISIYIYIHIVLFRMPATADSQL